MSSAGMSWALSTPRAETPEQRLFLLLCGDSIDQDGDVWLDLDHLAPIMCLPRAEVGRVARELVALGVAEVGDRPYPARRPRPADLMLHIPEAAE